MGVRARDRVDMLYNRLVPSGAAPCKSRYGVLSWVDDGDLILFIPV